MLTVRSIVLGCCCVLALAVGTARSANSQPNALPFSHGRMGMVTKIEGLPEPLGPEFGLAGSLRNAVCPPNRPYYKPSSYRRYMRHRFRPMRDYYPFDPPFRCASWPWSTDVCVGQYVAAHPVPVGAHCVR
jgi:hypothetical protein